MMGVMGGVSLVVEDVVDFEVGGVRWGCVRGVVVVVVWLCAIWVRCRL